MPIDTDFLNKPALTLERFYPEAEAYVALRKMLKSGRLIGSADTLKVFQNNSGNQSLPFIQAIVPNGCRTIKIRNDIYTAIKGEKKLIAKENQLYLNAYEFYSTHPNWKVRVAVVTGLTKFVSSKAVMLLDLLMHDAHKGVAQAAVQALTMLYSAQSRNLLEQTLTQKPSAFLYRLVRKSLNRIKFGNNFPPTNDRHLKKLLKSSLVRKIHHVSSQQNKLLVVNRILQGALKPEILIKKANHWQKVSGELTRRMFISYSGKKFAVFQKRATKHSTQRLKSNHSKSLFFNQRISVSALETELKFKPGEIYWAVTDTVDPKITRPVLIIQVTKAKDCWIVPLTTNLTSNLSTYPIEIDGRASMLQLHRHKLISHTALLNKYGEVASNEFSEVLDKLGKVKMPAAVSKNRHIYHCRNKLSKTFVSTRRELYQVDDIPAPFIPTANVF